VPRSPDKKNLLLILLGYDKPGIIAEVSKTLGKYNINIEFSQMVAREDIFLMELQTDISAASLPPANIRKVLSEHMSEMGISTMFQSEDVFNRKKRVILFDISGSFIGKETMLEIARQTGINEKELKSTFDKEPLALCNDLAAGLEGLSLDVFEKISRAFTVTSETTELLQTLKIMGYRIGLISNTLNIFTESMGKAIGLDFVYDFRVAVNDDDRTIEAKISSEQPYPFEKEKILNHIMERESLAAEDIIILSDKGRDVGKTPGIRFEFDMKAILDLFNQHILSKENIVGILGSFGIERLK
jgi:phosphoserine phosphatase